MIRIWVTIWRRRPGSQAFPAAAAPLRETAAEPTDEVVAELQLRAHLTREVLALDEPIRNALHHVFFLGLSIREAATQLGVSRSAVSDRVQEGRST